MIQQGLIFNKNIMKVVHSIALVFIVFFYSFCNVDKDTIIKESHFVIRNKSGMEYKTILIHDTGEVFLVFNPIIKEVTKDSAFITFVLWACPYYSGLEENYNDLCKSNKRFNMSEVKILQRCKKELGRKYQYGIYRVDKRYDKIGAVNDTVRLGFVRVDTLNLIFDVEGYNSLYVKL